MVRVTRNLRHAACLIICAGLAGCGSSDKGDDNGGGMLIEGLISFDADAAQPAHKGYSAFDGNAHDYQVVPNVPSASDMPSNTNPDPIMPGSLQWSVEDAFLKKEAFTDIPSAILVTTKKAGTTTIKVTGKKMSGAAVRGEAQLVISQADADQWTAGDARYNNGMMIDWGMIFQAGRMQAQGMMGTATSMGTCGLPFSLGDAIPKTSACGNCHNNSSGITVEHTPAQTAGYSDDDLIQIFTMGMKPAGYTFTSNILKYVPMPDCVYATFHTWQIDDETKKGIVWKLRSLKPMKAAPPPDPAQLAAQFRMMMMNGAGAMPAGGDMSGAAGSGM